MHDTGTVLYRCAPQSLQKLFIFLEFRAWIWLIIKEKLGKFDHFFLYYFCYQSSVTVNKIGLLTTVIITAVSLEQKRDRQTVTDGRTDGQAVALHYRRGRGIQRSNY